MGHEANCRRLVGGSAASVAASLGYAAVGTDTAGSIRLPAATAEWWDSSRHLAASAPEEWCRWHRPTIT